MMQRRFHAGSRSRTIAFAGIGLFVAVLFGLVAGRWPAVAVGGAIGLVIAIVMLRNLISAIVVFTVASFGAVLTLGHAATASKALGVVLVLAWVADLARESGGELRSFLRDNRGLVACAVGLVAWNLLSAVWAQTPAAALLGASRYMQNLVLFPILYAGVRRFDHVRWIAAAFVAGAVLAMLYGVASGTTVGGSRLVGAIGDPNETATVLVMASVLALGIGIGETRPHRRWLAFAAAMVAIFGVVATASRGGLVAMAAAAIVAVLIAGRWRRQIASAAAVAAVVAVGWFVFLAPSSSVSHITNVETPRTTLWTIAGRVIAANPVVGVGNDNFETTDREFLVRPGMTTDVSEILTTPHVAHSIYLEVWADTGAVGLALFIAVVLIPLRAAFTAVALLERAGRPAEEILARALIVAIAAILAAGFFISDEYSKQLFLLLALACAMCGVVRAEASGSRPGPAIAIEKAS